MDEREPTVAKVDTDCYAGEDNFDNKRCASIGLAQFRSERAGNETDFVWNLRLPVGYNEKSQRYYYKGLGRFARKSAVKGKGAVIALDNPAKIMLTVSDELHEPSYYSGAPRNHTMSAYELAEVRAVPQSFMKGNRVFNIPARDMIEGMAEYSKTSYFKQQAKKRLMTNMKAVSNSSEPSGLRIKITQWEETKNWAVGVMRNAMRRNAFHFTPISIKTQKEREAEGLNPNPPMYATGKLAECIIGRVVYGAIMEEVPF